MDFAVFMWILVIGTSVWMGAESSSLGAKRGRLGGGLFDMGAAGWFFGGLLLWIVFFPAYLATRGRYSALKQKDAP